MGPSCQPFFLFSFLISFPAGPTCHSLYLIFFFLLSSSPSAPLGAWPTAPHLWSPGRPRAHLWLPGRPPPHLLLCSRMPSSCSSCAASARAAHPPSSTCAASARECSPLRTRRLAPRRCRCLACDRSPLRHLARAPRRKTAGDGVKEGRPRPLDLEGGGNPHMRGIFPSGFNPTHVILQPNVGRRRFNPFQPTPSPYPNTWLESARLCRSAALFVLCH